MSTTLQTRVCLTTALTFASVALLAAPAVSKGRVSLTPAQGQAIVAPLYDALNEPTKKDVVALLAKATNPDYRSCSTKQDCLNRTQLAGQFKFFGKVIPDLHWKVLDLWTSGNRIVVRGEATGTPVAPLFGVAPTGHPFRTISIDMFTVVHCKLSTAYHVENWEAATDQIKAR